MSSRNDDDFSFDVDRNRLDDEWVKQPSNVKEASDRLAEAKRDLALSKRKLEVLEAEVALEIRENPEKFGLTKVTEKSVESAVISDSRIEKAKQEGIRLDYEYDIYKGFCLSLEHKKKALEDLVFLWSREFYSTPKAPEIAKEKMEEAKRKAAFGKNKSKEKSD